MSTKSKAGKNEGASADIKLRVLRRDRYRCVYCGASGNDHELQIDHVVPVSKGGSHHIGNLVTSCIRCNQGKSNKDAVPAILLKEHEPGLYNRSPEGTLTGLWVHSINPNGRIHYQGRIHAVEGDTVLVQLFSWLDGTSIEIITVPKSELLSDNWRRYGDRYDWIYAHAKELENHDELRMADNAEDYMCQLIKRETP